jgi:hypothetical protein
LFTGLFLCTKISLQKVRAEKRRLYDILEGGIKQIGPRSDRKFTPNGYSQWRKITKRKEY